MVLPQIPNTPIFYRSNQTRELNQQIINLENKDMKKIPLIEGEEKATHLNLSGNNIKQIENLVSLPSIEEINLSNNQIERLENFQNVSTL